MPALLTHKVGGDNVLRALEETDPQAADLVRRNRAAYYSGTQGGDYFYSYKYYSMWAGHRFKMFGWALHRARVRPFMLEGTKLIHSEMPNDIVRSYFLGYVTHYALDMHAHPLIRKMGPRPMTTHNVVEYALDCMYALRNGVDPYKFDKAAFVHDTYVPTDEIDDFLSEMMRRMYVGFTLPEQPYHTTYSYNEHYERIMSDTSRRSMAWRRFRDIFTILQTKYLVYRPVEQIRDMFDYDALFEAVDAGVDHAVRQIRAICGFWRGDRDFSAVESNFYNINMNGVPVVPLEERRTFKRMYKKAPTVRGGSKRRDAGKNGGRKVSPR